MEPSFVKKEEYTENQPLSKLIKREEQPEIQAKREDNGITNVQYSPPANNNEPMTLDWKNTTLQFSLINSLPNQLPLDLDYLYTQQVGKPFIIIRKTKIIKFQANEHLSSLDEESERDSAHSNFMIEEKKKVRRASTCKNYVGLLCAGLSRTILTAEPGTKILIYMKDLINQKKQRFESISSLDEQTLLESFTNYIYKVMCGKKVRKSNRERDFKIRNTKDLQNLVRVSSKDNEATSLNKEVLKEMIDYFFETEYYKEWLENGMITDHNKAFFLKNKDEIHKKFLSPGTYKPKFQDSSIEDI